MDPHVRGETTVESKGRTYRIRFTWARLLEVEVLLHRNLGEVCDTISRHGLDVLAQTTILRQGLLDEHPDIETKEVLALLDGLGKNARRELERVTRCCFTYAFPEMEEALQPGKGEPPPPAGSPASSESSSSQG